MTTKVLFVCLGNICRSPAAEGMMRHLVEQAGLSDQIQCDSAGTSAYHLGSPPDRRMQAAAQAQGISLVGTARQFTRQDFQDFDWIMAMDKENYHNIRALDPDGKWLGKVKLMCSYCRNHTDTEVPDPYYGGESGFRYVIELLQDACSGFLNSLKGS